MPRLLIWEACVLFPQTSFLMARMRSILTYLCFRCSLSGRGIVHVIFFSMSTWLLLLIRGWISHVSIVDFICLETLVLVRKIGAVLFARFSISCLQSCLCRASVSQSSFFRKHFFKPPSFHFPFYSPQEMHFVSFSQFMRNTVIEKDCDDIFIHSSDISSSSCFHSFWNIFHLCV